MQIAAQAGDEGVVIEKTLAVLAMPPEQQRQTDHQRDPEKTRPGRLDRPTHAHRQGDHAERQGSGIAIEEGTGRNSAGGQEKCGEQTGHQNKNQTEAAPPAIGAQTLQGIAKPKPRQHRRQHQQWARKRVTRVVDISDEGNFRHERRRHQAEGQGEGQQGSEQESETGAVLAPEAGVDEPPAHAEQQEKIERGGEDGFVHGPLPVKHVVEESNDLAEGQRMRHRLIVARVGMTQ